MIDFLVELKDMDGASIQAPRADGEKPAPATLKMAAVNALIQPFPDEKLDGAKKLDRGILAERIHLAKEPLDLTSEEVTLVKSVIGKMYPPLIVLRAWRLLDPAVK